MSTIKDSLASDVAAEMLGMTKDAAESRNSAFVLLILLIVLAK